MLQGVGGRRNGWAGAMTHSSNFFSLSSPMLQFLSGTINAPPHPPKFSVFRETGMSNSLDYIFRVGFYINHNLVSKNRLVNINDMLTCALVPVAILYSKYYDRKRSF